MAEFVREHRAEKQHREQQAHRESLTRRGLRRHPRQKPIRYDAGQHAEEEERGSVDPDLDTGDRSEPVRALAHGTAVFAKKPAECAAGVAAASCAAAINLWIV